MVFAKEKLSSLETDELSLQEADGDFEPEILGLSPGLSLGHVTLGKLHLTPLSLFVYEEEHNSINTGELL